MKRSTVISAPPFVHGFTTRAGGVSSGPFATWNFGSKWGDDPQCVAENRRRLLQQLGVDRLYTVKQVHGSDICTINDPLPSGEEIAGVPADALCTNVRGVALGVMSADCVGILMAAPETGVCAAAHAGWRGVVQGLAPRLVEHLGERYATEPGRLQVVLGPSIGPCCFEVGPEVAAQFPDKVRIVRAGRTYVDLRLALCDQLRAAGVVDIDGNPPCTYCNFDDFYSYRRACKEEGEKPGVTGLHMAAIARW